MKDISLQHTKKKLTIIFTLLVFALAVLLEFVFFTAKYYNYTFSEEKIFDAVTSKVENKFMSLQEFVAAYDIGKKVFKMGPLPGDNSDIIQSTREDLVNIIVIDKKKRELVFSNVTDNLSIKFVEDALNEGDYGEIRQDDGYLIKKIFLKEHNVNYDVLFIKNLRYCFGDYLTDLLGFIFITLLFSVFFYYIGLKFVSQNLKTVENNIKDMQDFIHNAGHELKTPISIIHSNLQLIQATKTFEPGLIKEGLTEINRLNHLIESLVELSNINGVENIVKLNLKNEIKEIINDFKVEAEKKKISIRLKKNDDKFLTVNKQYFYILLSNLIGNAIKYGNVGGKIDIILEKDKLIINDNGIGINKENLNKIFDRFFIIEKSRNIEGHGIGLSLVKKIADIYKWKIKVKSEEGKGSKFEIEF
ncbi:MAG: HAMP domain-containing sensor histidine kinase [Candidatus Gracilibacteria bacterium]